MSVQVTELKPVGLPVDISADTNVSYMIIRTESSLAVTIKQVTGKLFDVLTSVTDWLPKQKDWEVEADGERDLSTPAAILSAFDDRYECCYENDPDIIIVDLTTGQVIYKFGN